MHPRASRRNTIRRSRNGRYGGPAHRKQCDGKEDERPRPLPGRPRRGLARLRDPYPLELGPYRAGSGGSSGMPGGRDREVARISRRWSRDRRRDERRPPARPRQALRCARSGGGPRRRRLRARGDRIRDRRCSAPRTRHAPGRVHGHRPVPFRPDLGGGRTVQPVRDRAGPAARRQPGDGDGPQGGGTDRSCPVLPPVARNAPRGRWSPEGANPYGALCPKRPARAAEPVERGAIDARRIVLQPLPATEDW